ncbi:hypothetical protein DFH09DRAFT_1317802 [Mycena vulgaris]|nr:hypothetical protein DFH09DRAFT_1317802 [Mycena vulgaris]
MSVVNAQRALDYICIILAFITQSEYQDLVQMPGIVNEVLMSTIGKDQLPAFSFEAHPMMHSIISIGAGQGPFMSIHDGFQRMQSWAGFLSSDRVILDTHTYFAFDQQPNDAPIVTIDEPGSAADGT